MIEEIAKFFALIAELAAIKERRATATTEQALRDNDRAREITYQLDGQLASIKEKFGPT